MKRIFDIFSSLIGLAILSPIFIIISLLILILHGRPIFFLQTRPGLMGKSFNMIKFRTMSDKKDHNGLLLDDNQRITKIGRFLRSSSLDELPELLNVLFGNMSIVGPRPLLMEYLELYDENQKKRHNVKPGITGWAQINGRNSLSWDEKFDLDIWYVKNQSFFLDIKIILITIIKVLLRSDINSSENTTMPRFTGKKNLKNENNK